MVGEVVRLKGIQRGTGILGVKSWAGLTPDNSILLLREASTEEIYALDGMPHNMWSVSLPRSTDPDPDIPILKQAKAEYD